MKRTTPLVALACLLIVLLGAGGCVPRFDPSQLHGTLLQPPMAAKEFVLTSAEGPVELSDFRGRFVLLSFGYTSCPLVCPTTMGRLAKAMDLMGPAADLMQVLMITVDPDRDSPQRLKEYLAKFDERFVGVSGTRNQISDVASMYGIYHEFPETDEDRAELGHSAQTLVLDREGRTLLIWPYDVPPEDLAADLGALLERY